MTKGDFTGRAAVYDKYRPGYPEKLMDYLCKANGLTEESLVADVGSGTGKFTAQLLQCGLRVAAVEPNDDMRAAAEAALSANPRFRSVCGSAERTTLESHSVDLVTAAQAFHWFDHARFREECRRILKPGASVFLVWNNRDPESEIVLASAEICRRYCPNFEGFSGPEREPESLFEKFYHGSYEKRIFANDIPYRMEEWVGRYLSSSYAPKPGEEYYEPFVEAFQELFVRFAEGDTLYLPNVTLSYLGQVM